MRRFLFLMHADTTAAEDLLAWGPYLGMLQSTGHFEGGSSLGAGDETFRLSGQPTAVSNLVGYLIVDADDPAGARALLDGNPTYVAGGTVEIRELIKDDES
jgi:hypothetical protein